MQACCGRRAVAGVLWQASRAKDHPNARTWPRCGSHTNTHTHRRYKPHTRTHASRCTHTCGFFPHSPHPLPLLSPRAVPALRCPPWTRRPPSRFGAAPPCSSCHAHTRRRNRRRPHMHGCFATRASQNGEPPPPPTTAACSPKQRGGQPAKGAGGLSRGAGRTANGRPPPPTPITAHVCKHRAPDRVEHTDHCIPCKGAVVYGSLNNSNRAQSSTIGGHPFTATSANLCALFASPFLVALGFRFFLFGLFFPPCTQKFDFPLCAVLGWCCGLHTKPALFNHEASNAQYRIDGPTR